MGHDISRTIEVSAKNLAAAIDQAVYEIGVPPSQLTILSAEALGFRDEDGVWHEREAQAT